VSTVVPIKADAAGEGGGSRRVRSAERVAAVLQLLSESDQPLRHAQVAEAIGLPKSSASNLLDTLADVGLISKTTQGYALGVWLIELGRVVADRLDVRAIARPVMEELSRFGVGTCNLAMLQGGDIIYLEKVSNPSNPIQIATRVGGRLPAHATGMGKCLVAWLPVDERSRWLEAQEFVSLTDRTIVDSAQFVEELHRVRAQGYGVDNQESHLDVICVGAPIRDYTKSVKYAISVTCLRSDVEVRGVESIAAEVIAAADELSRELGAEGIHERGASRT
jgi:DNA-binding IclR family transcriptional regulator